MAPINVGIDLGVKGFLKGTKDMEEALTDVSDAMEDVAKSGDKDVEKLTDKLKEAKRAADDAADAGERIGKDYRKGTKEAESGLQDFKQEANSTAKESAASFDGSAESIVDSFQEIAANAFEGFGAAGAVAGLAVAAGIGIATAEFQKSEEAAKATKERIAELGTAFIESGADVATLESFQGALQGIVTNADDAVVKIDDLNKFTKKYGDRVPDVADMAMAYAGNKDAIKSVTKQLEEAISKEESLTYKTKDGTEQSAKRVKAYQEQIDKIQQVQKETELAKQIEEDYLASGGGLAQAKADAIGLINNAYDEAVGSVTDFVNKETGIFDIEAYLGAIDARKQALQDYQIALANAGLTSEQKQALNDMGIESASALMAGWESYTPEQKARTKAALTEAAREGSASANTELEKAFDKPIEAKIKAKAYTESAQQDLDNLIAARTAIIKVDFRDREGRPVG